MFGHHVDVLRRGESSRTCHSGGMLHRPGTGAKLVSFMYVPAWCLCPIQVQLEGARNA